jgi:hypothetical protein
LSQFVAATFKGRFRPHHARRTRGGIEANPTTCSTTQRRALRAWRSCRLPRSCCRCCASCTSPLLPSVPSACSRSRDAPRRRLDAPMAHAGVACCCCAWRAERLERVCVARCAVLPPVCPTPCQCHRTRRLRVAKTVVPHAPRRWVRPACGRGTGNARVACDCGPSSGASDQRRSLGPGSARVHCSEARQSRHDRRSCR